MPKLSELAAFVEGEVIGDGGVEISGVTGLDGLRAGTITLGATEKAIKIVIESPVAAVIVPNEICHLAKPGIRVANPRMAYLKILTYFSTPLVCEPGIHPTAIIGDNFSNQGCQIGPWVFIGNDVSIGQGTVVYPGVFIGDRVTIDANSIIYPNVVIREECVIGARVLIHPGAVIGADGFGYVTAGGRHSKMPQIGNVIIEDEVEIGANTCIDRATTNVTLIRKGTKIDNLVQVGHNCIIGENNMLCGQVGLAGSSILEDRVTLGGKVGSVGHLTIGHDSTVGGCSKITGDVPPSSFLSGDPARSHQKQMRIQASLSRLPELTKEIRELRKMVLELKKNQAPTPME